MNVYDPRLDTEPGAHPDDERYHAETTNPALLMLDLMLARGAAVDWDQLVKAANLCDERVGPPTIVDVLPGGKNS